MSNLKTVNTQLSSILFQKEAQIDLSELVAQQKANSFWHHRQKPYRYVFRWMTEDLLSVHYRGHELALYVKSLQRLYRIEGSLDRHWRLVNRAIRQVFPIDDAA